MVSRFNPFAVLRLTLAVTEQEAPLSLSPTSTMSSIKRRGGNGEENLGSKKRVEMLARYESSPYTPLKKVQSQRRKPIPFARDDEATPEANPFFKSHAESPSTAAQATFALPTRPAPAEDESAPQDVEQPTVTSITTISAGPVTLAALRIPRVETIQFRIKGKSGNHDQIFDLTRMFNACQNLAIKQVSIFRMWYEKESPGRRIDNWTNPNCYRQFKLIHKPSAWQSKVGRTRACQTCASQGYPCVIRPNYKSATKSVRGRRTVAGPDAVIEFLPLNHDAAGVEYTDEEYWVQGGLDAAEGAVRRDLEGRGKGKGVKGKGKAKVVESTEEEAEDDPASG